MDVSKMTYEEISQKADDLADSGKTDEAIELLRQGLKKAEAAQEEAYVFFFQAELVYYQDGNYERSLELHKQALGQDPENVLFLRNVGVLLSYLDREEEAIGLYDQALAIKQDDYRSLRQKGVSLSILGREKEAVESLNEALAIKPNDYRCLRDKGATLCRLGRQEEAAEYLDKSLKMNPENHNAWDWKSTALEELEDFEGALQARRKHREFNRNREYEGLIEYKISFLEKKLDDLNRGVEEKAIEPEDEIFAKVIEAFQEDEGKILETIAENEEKLKAFTSKERSIPSQTAVSFLSVLRKWTSYTPVLPSTNGDNRGGGYFLHIPGKNGAEGRGIVIDPGFNFVENFYEEGFKAADIDAVLISHAHNDHTVDLEAIIALIKKINDNIEEETGEKGEKRIDLFLNLGTFQKYSGWLSLKDSETINEVTVLHAGKTYDLSDKYNGLVIHAVRAKHDEIISDQYCLGFILELEGCRIALTGDTGWEVDGSIAQPYTEKNIDLMIAHLGSIKKIEFDYINKNTPEEKQKCLYPNHLGILGMGAMLNCVRPRLAVISEFGEELKPLRQKLVAKFDKVFGDSIKCIPADVGLHIRIPDLSIYSIVHRDFVPFADIKIVDPKKGTNLQYYKEWDDAAERGTILIDASDKAAKEKAVPLFDRIKRGPVTPD